MAVIALLIGIAFSCEKEDPVPSCEQNKVGSVLVINNTPYMGEFDVTWGDVVEYQERIINSGNSYPYNNVPAYGHPESYGGQIELWAKVKIGSTWTNWTMFTEDLSPCEEMEYEWYMESRKSTEVRMLVDVYRNGVFDKTVEAVRAEKVKK